MSLSIEEIRAKYYPNLTGQTYLDHSGTTVYSTLLLDRIREYLGSTLLANPHSRSQASLNAEKMIESTRLKVLQMFNADPVVYDIAFMQNATQAIKTVGTLVGDASEYDSYYNMHCHTSMIGLREKANKFKVWNSPDELDAELDADSSPACIVGWPGQSNFSGKRLPIGWDTEIKAKKNLGHCYTLFDAAALSTTCPPDLSESSVDFVVVSFYKIFGLPDLGALIFRKEAAEPLIRNRKYFGGGTIDAVALDNPFVALSKELHTAIEDGTVPVHSVSQLSLAIDTQLELYGSFDRISKHTSGLRTYAIEQLKRLKYPNGQPMIELYDEDDNAATGLGYGPIVALSLKNVEGNYVGYYSFERLASLQNISFRTGGMCNAGSVQTYLHRTGEEIERDYHTGHKCGDHMDVIDGRPTGAIRISFGAMTIKADIDTFVQCAKQFLTEKRVITTTDSADGNDTDVTISQLVIYPIKSCPGYSIPKGKRWKVTPKGLQYDRVLAVVGLLDGKNVSLKSHPEMSFLRPTVDDGKNLVVTYTKMGETLKVPVDLSGLSTEQIGGFEAVTDKKVSKFFSDAIGFACTLGRKPDTQMQSKSAFLLVNQRSLAEITPDSSLISRFRSNIVIRSKEPFVEDEMKNARDVESGLELIKTENCTRCGMVTITDEGTTDPTLLRLLAQKRKRGGNVYFGVNMNVGTLGDGTMAVGDELQIIY